MEPKINKSEIINQKKQFIFDVEQSSDYVFPNEVFNYFIYIKNISGTKIDGFKIQIENNKKIVFEETNFLSTSFSIESDEVKLYEIKAHCSAIGEHIVHFIGFGKGTEILYETLKINCTRTFNSDKLLHRISIYNFSPYEEKYSMESTNYSNEVTQIFKKQKRPYKAGEQPFPAKKDFISENVESESFLEQYEKAKNSEEHVYQYLGREDFTENAIESFTGKNLADIFEKINKESKYFRGKFLKTGTNSLLNDFRRYAPNGFIYRMGLLNSEIYHNLGVIPTYSYMSDHLFRWAPSEEQLLDLTPKKESMRWDENIWAGRGWIVYKTVTPEYTKTKEFLKEKENNLIQTREIVGSFSEKRTAEEFVRKTEQWDEIIRVQQKSDVVKYNYEIYESLYDNGVFFINIPVNKIPSNFYLLNNEDLYALVNRAKPFGTKPIINYIIEKSFNLDMNIKVIPNYYKKFLVDLKDFEMNYDVFQKSFTMQKLICDNQESFYPAFTTIRSALSNTSLYNDHDMDMIVSPPQITFKRIFDHDMTINSSFHKSEAKYNLNNLNNLLETLYQGNYNNIAFKIRQENFSLIPNGDFLFTEGNEGEIVLNDMIIQSLKMRGENDKTLFFEIQDIHNQKHRISIEYDKDKKMNHVYYSYINKNGKEYIRKEGYEKIIGVCSVLGKINNKKILIFMVEDEHHYLHYFHHVIVFDIYCLNTNKESNKISYNYGILYEQIIFETPFIYEIQKHSPKLVAKGNNWNNLYRLNEKKNSNTFINNTTNDYITPDDILLFYDQINIPETAIIKEVDFKITGNNSFSKNIYINKSFNTNYLTNDVDGYKIQLSPKNIECYSHLKESTKYYQIKLKEAEEKEQTNLAKEISKLLTENYIFNEDISKDVPINTKYLSDPNNFLPISNRFWYELSDFTELSYKLNDVSDINFVIEGYNTEYESQLLIETLSEAETSTTVKEEIPSGYFRKKIPLLFSNQYLLELLRIRFRFNNLNHEIKVFDTKIELIFKNKQEKDISYEFIDKINLVKEKKIMIEENYQNPSDLNNGLSIKLGFDDLGPGGYYQLSSTELDVLYKETELDVVINDDKYKDDFSGTNKSVILGNINNCYLSGLFYNDVATMSQLEDNIGIDNRGIKLQDSLYQLFETRDDNITSIEIFPYGFKGNPDETLKIGLYENSYNSPGKLIKEIYASGWVKNNPKLKNLDRIKYNFNIDNLKINEKYWFKIEVLNPQENSYYLLKGINNTLSGYKLLANENNNYINTFSNLMFNIYSKNLSKSFNTIPVLQESFYNPYVSIGLHKQQGSIEDLQIEKCIKSDVYMNETFEDDPEIEVFRIFRKTKENEIEELSTK